MKNIKDYNLDSLKEEFVQMGEKPFRAEQVFKWLYDKSFFTTKRKIKRKLYNVQFQDFKKIRVK